MTFADYRKVLVKQDISLLKAVKLMNESSMQILLVAGEDDSLLGVVTDGDIRRALSANIDFDMPISLIMNRRPITLEHPAGREEALDHMKRHDIRHIPIVNQQKRITGLVLWKDFFENGDVTTSERPNTVVIMAGGKGTRLDLFTKILPKPLIPISDKPIIEHIMDNFAKYGFNKFLISLNYKADMIRMYFSENHNDYEIDYVQEKDFLGTGGGLALAKDRLDDTFIVSNCDVIIDTNLDRLFAYHKENENHATVLCTVRNIKIPYGVMKAKEANLEDIIEKPEYSFVINSGIYVLEPEVVDLVTAGKPIDMPDLLLRAKEKGFKVQIYPMTCTWFDVGEWGEYKRALDHITALGVRT